VKVIDYIFLLIIFCLFGCDNKLKEFEVELYLQTKQDIDIQVFYSTSYFDNYSEKNSKTVMVEEGDSSVNFSFKTDKPPIRLRIDLNTDEEITLEVDSLKITYNAIEYLVQPDMMKDFFLFNPQVEADFINNKMILKTVKDNNLYDPFLVTKNLSKHLY